MTAEARDISTCDQTAWLASGEAPAAQESVVQIAVAALSVADSPRKSGENPEHVQALAAAHGELPPIVVHYPTMHVIDGVHRLRVAKSKGDDQISARFFHGGDADAFVLAVKSNISHGLPLSLADRRAAAVRIVVSHQQWSDRMIASVTGLAARTVAEIRRQDAGNSARGEARIGRDGRVRPINGADGRMLASQLITDNPALSLRQIARAAGISPETARDVRNRLQLGEDPVLNRCGKKAAGQGSRLGGRPPEGHRREFGARAGHTRTASDRSTVVVAVERLRADPALRFTETGRMLLRLLHVHLVEIEGWQEIGDNVPSHCSGIIANLARECAEIWRDLAVQLDGKIGDAT